jgi:hypothetical protein
MTSGQKRFPIAPSKFKFGRHGQSGAWVSELLPHTAKVVDELCFIKSVHTEAINHDPAVTYMLSGSQIPGRPSLGAWLSYGLGSLNRNLPAFVVLHSSWSSKRPAQALYERLWGTGFLPTQHAGVSLRSQGEPVLFLSNPPGVSGASRRDMLDVLAELNQQQFDSVGDPEIQTRIQQYEMAYRMQSSVPELTDFSDESPATLEMYGPDVHKPGTFAANCLLARRLRPARQSAERPGGAMRGRRSGAVGAHSRSEAAGAVGRYARRVGDRVRPDRVLPGGPDA